MDRDLDNALLVLLAIGGFGAFLLGLKVWGLL